MKCIPLTQGQVALIDNVDFEHVNAFKWYAQKITKKGYVNWYAARRFGRVLVYMHHWLFCCSGLDHIDCNGLNNQKSNLRLATSSQNNFNRRKAKGKSSIYKGACLCKNGTWRSCIKFNNKTINLGTFKSEKAAALAYSEKAKQLAGNFARGSI